MTEVPLPEHVRRDLSPTSEQMYKDQEERGLTNRHLDSSEQGDNNPAPQEVLSIDVKTTVPNVETILNPGAVEQGEEEKRTRLAGILNGEIQAVSVGDSNATSEFMEHVLGPSSDQK